MLFRSIALACSRTGPFTRLSPTDQEPSVGSVVNHLWDLAYVWLSRGTERLAAAGRRVAPARPDTELRASSNYCDRTPSLAVNPGLFAFEIAANSKTQVIVSLVRVLARCLLMIILIPAGRIIGGTAANQQLASQLTSMFGPATAQILTIDWPLSRHLFTYSSS